MKEHVIINRDRTVVVPESLKKIGIQFDHNVNTITFDCPRYPDEDSSIDMSQMPIFINYMLPDKTPGSSLALNVVVDETDNTLMHFDWKITNAITPVNGVLSTLICVKQSDTEGNELYHWNTDLFQKFTVGNGMECNGQVAEMNPDVITQLLARMGEVDTRTSAEAMSGYVNEYMTENPPQPTDEQVGSGVNTYMASNGQTHVNAYMTENQELVQNSVDDYLGRNPLQLDDSLIDSTKAAPADKVGELKGDIVDLGTGKIDKPTTANNNKIPRANNGEVEWVEVGQPTDEQTETAITNWLDNHPEATTTVQDGSLTENKFTEDLRNHTIKDYVTPEMFGAVGDGTTDDVLAIESAINTKKPILLTKKYYISRPINIIDNTRIYGDRINRRYDEPIDTCYIKSMSGFFHNANGVNMVFLLDIALWNLDNSKPVFDCALDRCVFRIYGYNIGTFANSLQSCCFNDSYLLNSAGNFSNYTSDTKFSNCYISGNTEKRNSVFTGTVSALFMSDCYLDFWYEVFKPSYSVNNMVTNNVFDACYHVFVGDYHGFGVINNVFMRIKDSVLWTLNKDDWCVFCNGLRNNTRSIGNKVDADYYIHTKLTGASYPNSNSISIGNSLNNTTKIVWEPYPNDSTDLLNTRVEEINFKTYDTLPNPVLTDGSNERFNHQFAEHNGAMYLNQNGKWKQISGTKEFVKEVSAMTIPAHSVSSVLVTESNVISNIFYIARPNKKLTGVVYDCYSYTDTEIRIDIANPTDQEVSLPDIMWKVKGFN